ncbi:DUF6281 family protein [Streptomyces sp. NPDC052693]|uniref:DUF6281 family protein n=1 Tax=Streptomyces sp. NPDC052693 TaxID=3155814 RepID=UPI00341F713B
MKAGRTTWAPAVVAVGAALSAGCAPSSPDGVARAAPSCAYVVEYDGRRYLDWEETTVPLGRSLGSTTRPACDDTPGDGDDGEGPVATTAFAVPGVDPAVAVAVAEGAGTHRLVVAESVEHLPPGLRKLTEGP